MADHAIEVLELLVEATYSSDKRELLVRANRQIEVLRWLVRLAKDRKLLTQKQYLYGCTAFAETGRMVGGWLKHATGKGVPKDAPPQAVVRAGVFAEQPVRGGAEGPTRQAQPASGGGLSGRDRKRAGLAPR